MCVPTLAWLPLQAGPTKVCRFLIVEDDVPLRRIVHGLLEKHEGWSICGEAANGSEAVQSFPNVLPDITLMDFQLPEMNGLDASRAILRDFPDAAILLFTIHVSEQLKREAWNVGIKGVCSKSEMWHVLDAIDALSRGETYFCH